MKIPTRQTRGYYDRYARHAAQAVAHLWDAPPIIHEHLTNPQDATLPSAKEALKSSPHQHTSAWRAAHHAINDEPTRATAIRTLEEAQEAAWSTNTENEDTPDAYDHLAPLLTHENLHQHATN